MNTIRHYSLPLFFALALSHCTGMAQDQPGGAESYREPFRPQFHFSPARNWMNDPNGMVYYEGEYHLFYQYNPEGDKWGHMSWAHAVSRDLLHWQTLPLALPESDGVMIFSGSAVVDWQNTSGFGSASHPPLVAVYTGFRPADGRQFQCLASSIDRGRTWTKYAANPVIDLKSKDFRDPKVQWHAPTKKWVMTVSLSAEHKVQFYGSPNLKDWTLLSEFGPTGATSGVWECPDLFELPIAGKAEKRWVLAVNIGSGSVAGGSGGQYFVGQFDGLRFTADPAAAPSGTDAALWFDYGKDYYAAVSWSDVPKRDGRRLWLGWMSNWQYGQDVPTQPWRSAMSIPREVRLQSTPEGVRLFQRPVAELRKLRERSHSFGGGDVAQANRWIHDRAIAGNQLEIELDLQRQTSGTTGIRVLKGGSEATSIGVRWDQGRVYVDRTQSGQVGFNKQFPGIHEAPLIDRGATTRLHLFVDHASVEVFVNDGERVLTDVVFPSSTSQGLELFGSDAAGAIQRMKVWTLRSIWH